MTSLASLAATSHRLGETSSRLTKVRELTTYLRELEPDEVEVAVQYLAGEIPQGRFGIGYALLHSASSVAAASDPVLSISDVDRRLTEIAAIRGTGSAQRRSDALRELFSLATPLEQGFLLRLLMGELRQGALAGVMTDAVAAAANIPIKQVRRAAMYSKNLGALARAAMLQGVEALSRFQLELFSPISPMLAQTATDVAEALTQYGGEVAFEWKMDGARIQVHKGDDVVRVYTRTLNDVTAAVPEIADMVRALSVREAIFDGEAISFNSAGRPHPFQITMRRFGRKLDVEKLLVELPMRAYFFDCLRLDGQSLADKPARERFHALTSAVPVSTLVPRLVTSSESQARAFYEASLEAGHEGVMAKSLDAP